jgi:hypothetical protein
MEAFTGAPPVYYVMHERGCEATGQQITMHVGPYENGYADEQGGIYYYTPPAGVTISGYRMAIAAYAGSCEELTGTSCRSGVGQVFVAHTGEVDPEYDFRDLGQGDVLATVERRSLQKVEQVWIGVTCDGLFGRCTATKPIASVAIPWAEFSLQDSTLPKVEVAGSPVAAGSALAGEVEWAFGASDSGSGIYSVGEEVDGRLIKQEPLDEGGNCRNIAAAGMRTFDAPQPCAPSLNSFVSLNTNDLSDGSHHLRLFVEDAAGDKSDFFDGGVVTRNGPTLEGSPAISGVAKVGSALSATNGVFRARPGDTLTTVAGQWERCSAPPSCESIPSATGASYVPTSEDAGHLLVYLNTAAAVVSEGSAKGLGHTTMAGSIPTLPVAEASGSGAACAILCPTLAPGIGGNASDWRVSLSVSPRRVHRHSTIRLWGLVTTSPRPSAGKLVYLEARDVGVERRVVHGRRRSVQVYGRWITFTVLRAKPSGAFATTYRFRLGGLHLYQFRAVAPAEGQFPNATGQSPIVAVKER